MVFTNERLNAKRKRRFPREDNTEAAEKETHQRIDAFNAILQIWRADLLIWRHQQRPLVCLCQDLERGSVFLDLGSGIGLPCTWHIGTGIRCIEIDGPRGSARRNAEVIGVGGLCSCLCADSRP